MTAGQRQAIRERIGSRRVCASISGGKDSAAMSLWLKELEIDHDRVFLNTGWEHEATLKYLHGDLERALGPIVWRGSTRYPDGMVQLVRERGLFPSRKQRFCTEELKKFPMVDHLRWTYPPDGVVSAVGIRHGESAARALQPEWEWSDDFGCLTWRPLVSWSVEDVIAIHHRHGLRPNPLYLWGAERVGCHPCIFASKQEIRLILAPDRERVELIRSLEEAVTQSAIARYAAKGETLESKGYANPAWFQAQGRLRKEGRDGRPVAIGTVLKWAQTSRGGRQFELFEAPAEDRGCMRWGLCDTVGERITTGAAGAGQG